MADREPLNLNTLGIPTDTWTPQPLTDHSTSTPDGSVRVYFRHLEDALIKHINDSVAAYGCIAWLTSFPILEALAKLSAVSIIVQKEDFLRPDAGIRPSDRTSDWKWRLHRAYNALPSIGERWGQREPLGSMSYATNPTVEAVRCVGVHNASRAAAAPRAHHKFLVLRGLHEDKVWTGSFNFTQNATLSFENAVVLTHPEIVDAYAYEWAQIAALSEPLDWTSDYVEPEWRIGS